MSVALGYSDLSAIGAFYDGDGVPRSALRIDYAQSKPCGRIYMGRYSTDGYVETQFVGTASLDPEQLLVVPVGHEQEFMTSTATSLTWTQQFLKGRTMNDLWFSSSLEAVDYVGHLAIGNLKNGQTLFVDTLDGAPPGQYYKACVVGDVAFVARYDEATSKVDWGIYRDGQLAPFLGGSDLHVPEFITDGETMVWLEGSDPDASGTPTYTLYRAPYTTVASSIQPTTILAGAPATLRNFVLANGMFLATYFAGTTPDRAAGLVVRLSDNAAQRFLAPGGYNVGFGYPAQDELWLPVTKTLLLADAESILRVPYASLASLASP